MRNLKLLSLIALLATLMLIITACGGGASGPTEEGATGEGSDTESGERIDVNASGSSFIAPLFTKMFDEYNTANEGVRVNYQSTGSGTGISQLIEGTVDFAASDAPMNSEELDKMGEEVLHIPMAIAPVAIALNIEGLEGNLNLSPEVLADIFLGEITNWNDPAIAEINEGVELSDQAIAVVHRSDGSGTTFIFSEYLTAVDQGWADAVGTGKSLDWPVGIGAKGSEGVSGQVGQIPGSIGYVEVSYALQNDMSVANIQNQEGEFIAPSLESASAAAAGAVPTLPEDLIFSMVDMPGEGTYPIAGTTWALVPQELGAAVGVAKAEKIKELLTWANSEGQQYAPDLTYAPLPKEMQELNQTQIDKINTAE
ncbi:phosphate ABC transporter substrate-binding protein PstS [Bacillus fonticola]|uniref:phosphate ABC transporter substrate-binding protein PstS n=1 Tax=Bacillus fonticola TaxID=2728853 RepID=UPI0014733832|nr:phosphate ABC transporter substrate-binding protein PstS [Bacillus fonticola]